MKTLSSIAKELGVSVATVSYVYNDKWRENRIGEALARRIQDRLTAEQVVPSALGNQLRTGSTRTIGIVLSDLTKHYYLDLLCGIEQELAPQGYLSLLCPSEHGEKESHYLSLLLSRGVDGIILAPHRPDAITAQVQEVQNRKLPIVLVDNYLPETDLDFVVSDNRWGAGQAVRYCLQRGCQQIGCISGPAPSLAAIRDRLQGAQDPIPKSAGPVFRLLPPSLPEMEQAIATMAANGKKTAIFVSSFYGFEQGFQMLARVKLRIPHDLILIGFDPVPMEALGDLCALLDEPIPVVKQAGREMGVHAARRLLARLHDNASGPCREFLKPDLSFKRKKENQP